MRKRERENPCGICGHYHKFEEGEICGVCGHRAPVSSDKTSLQVSAFPSVILPDFLYLGSYDNASRSELLKTQGITRVLNVSRPSFDALFIIVLFFFFFACNVVSAFGCWIYGFGMDFLCCMLKIVSLTMMGFLHFSYLTCWIKDWISFLCWEKFWYFSELDNFCVSFIVQKSYCYMWD